MLLLLACPLLAGCRLFDETHYMTLKVPEDRLRTIEMLHLDEMVAPAEEESGTETDQPPPAELELSLAECRALALEHNLDLQVELINPTIAAESIGEEEARFEALLFANARLSKSDTPISTTLIGSQTETRNVDLGVTMPLRTGGTLTATLPVNRFETDNPFSTLNPAYTTDFRASISQPLLRNAGPRTATYGIRVARYNRQVTESRTKLEVMRVIAAVDRVYWQLYAARRQLEVRVQEYDLAKEQLERARRLVANEVAAEVEIIRAESGVADRLEAIIVAENTVRERQRDLKRALNKPALDMQSPTVVVPVTQPNPVRYRLDAGRLINAALDQRMEMLELEIQLAIDHSTVDFLRNQVLPMVNLDYTYNVNGLGASLDDSFEVLNDRNFEDHSLGLTVQIPLGNEAAKSRLRRALFSRIQRLSTRAQRAASIRQEVLNATDRIEANWQRILASRQRTVLAARTLAAEQRQFDQGLRTSTDVLDAQTKLTDAQSAEILALTEYQIAQVDLAVATGTLLGSARVRWEPIVPARAQLNAH